MDQIFATMYGSFPTILNVFIFALMPLLCVCVLRHLDCQMVWRTSLPWEFQPLLPSRLTNFFWGSGCASCWSGLR